MTTESTGISHGQIQIEAVKEAFEREFERFARLRGEQLSRLALPETEAALRELSDLRTRAMGKKSELAALKKTIGRVPPEERAAFAQGVQALEAEVADQLDGAEKELRAHLAAARLERERIDVTLPGTRRRAGHLHPITLLRQRIEDIFVSMGYSVEDGPEVETDFYNFDALNIPATHPARSPQDTFYLENDLALRSQTSTVQIHAMQKRRPPLRVIAPGRVFRRDTPDATHNPMFFQLEGLLVDRGITLGHLKGTITEFVQRMFGPETRTRFRPSYFPFTEPSAEVDYSCFKCHGAGCRICKQSGWIELGGSGMVHPNVLHAVGIDSDEWSGFAFGLGIDRMCALMYELDDIRLLFENDVRFLSQFE
ncbi:MAG TPA: phenylalanine--tRNA ligase subunit alpha [Pyrinomonadaceae bacterium]|jgi:phenylalanyl-tRNA synthetase alpha chain|nr:phenylalanine--tRNA ligase subunit alpha [Pyrinomonadaceae bacterium]